MLSRNMVFAAAVCLVNAPLSAETPPPSQPLHIPTRSGEVILPTQADQQNYNQYGFAALRRAAGLVFISGVVVGRRPDEGSDVEAFKDQVRRAFRRLQTSLQAADLDFDDVVMINSFHIWQGPNFSGTKDEQFKAFELVKKEFMRGPKPAWTAVGSTGLLPDTGIVEIQMIAAAPEKPRRH